MVLPLLHQCDMQVINNTILPCLTSYQHLNATGNQQAGSGHDISLEDLRALVMSVVMSEKCTPPARFEIKNKAKLRAVAHVHFSDCPDFSFIDELATTLTTRSLRMRISPEISRTYIFPERFYTISKSDIEHEGDKVSEQGHDQSEREKDDKKNPDTGTGTRNRYYLLLTVLLYCIYITNLKLFLPK